MRRGPTKARPRRGAHFLWLAAPRARSLTPQVRRQASRPASARVPLTLYPDRSRISLSRYPCSRPSSRGSARSPLGALGPPLPPPVPAARVSRVVSRRARLACRLVARDGAQTHTDPSSSDRALPPMTRHAHAAHATRRRERRTPAPRAGPWLETGQRTRHRAHIRQAHTVQTHDAPIATRIVPGP